VTICIDEDVLGLDVSVYNVVGMNVLDGKKLGNCVRGHNIKSKGTYKLCHVEPYRVQVE